MSCVKCGGESTKSYCRPCTNTYNREYYHKNKERLLARMRERDPEARWGYNLKRWYGITAKDYYNLLESQGGCAVCGSTTPRMSRISKFHVDHCHETGKVRGLLCGPCNRLLGFADDKPDVLRLAADYLERS